MADLVLRFVIGGVLVSAFAAIGELFEPKTFAGLFGAAPSVAVASLALTYGQLGAAATATSAGWMVAGSGALVIYGACCVWTCRARRIPVWLGALGAWLVWGAVAYAIWWIVHRGFTT